MTSARKQRLVIFGCGYVGTAVALEAAARGVEVTALTRSAASAVVLREQGITAVAADLASADWHERVAGAPDFVLNCVGAGGGGIEGYRHSYLEGMESVLAWARERGPAGTIVYTSSTSVYPQEGGVVVDEAAPTGGGERAAVLLATEEALWQHDGACRRWFILRLAGIYGPSRHHFVDQVRSGTVAGRGQHHLNLAHRDDIAAAIRACFDAPDAVRDEIFNVADDEPARKTDVVAWLAGQLALPAPQFTGAATAGRERLTPDRLIANRKLKTMLGWRPRFPTFREGCASFLSL